MMRTLEETFGIALRQRQEGRSSAAADGYRQILSGEPNHPGASHLLGVTCHERGDFQQAVEHIRRAIALDGSKAVFWNNLGAALRALGRVKEAEEAYRRALSISPRYADALSKLGAILHELGKEGEPLKLLREALRLQPAHRDALFNLANLYQALGRTEEAVATYRKAIAVQPRRAGAHNNLGNALLAARDAAQAVASYRAAIRLEPGFAEAQLNLAAAYAQQEKVEAADLAYQAASRLRPEKRLWKMRSAGLCPVVFESAEGQDRYRAELERHLDAYREVPFETRWEDLAAEGFIPSFNLKHHGRDNRRLKEKFAALFEPLCPQRRPCVHRTGKPRIGFLVTRPHEWGLLRTMGGIVEHLDRRFVPVVLCSRSVLGTCRAGIRRAFSGTDGRKEKSIALRGCVLVQGGGAFCSRCPFLAGFAASQFLARWNAAAIMPTAAVVFRKRKYHAPTDRIVDEFPGPTRLFHAEEGESPPCSTASSSSLRIAGASADAGPDNLRNVSRRYHRRRGRIAPPSDDQRYSSLRLRHGDHDQRTWR